VPSQLPRGLHESLLTEALASALSTLDADSDTQAVHRPLEPADAGDRIGLHLGRVIQRVVESLPPKQQVEAGIRLARALLDVVHDAHPKAGADGDRPDPTGQVLAAILGRAPDGTFESLPSPGLPLLDTTLLTNAPDEPRVGAQLPTEIASADRIDVVMAFIRKSGIQPLLAALKAHTAAGRAVRVLTTTYTGTTDVRALELLVDAGAEVRVSYDTTGTRLHAKAWLFERSSGFSTAYIGSSNLTHQAQQTGLEWNVRVSQARNAPVIEKMRAVFESYWNAPEFEVFDREVFVARVKADAGAYAGGEWMLPPTDLRLEPFQKRMLEQIALAREAGHHRNLLVSATGTGKTVMAAADYADFARREPSARVLFVAHRTEILDQARATFRYALRDHAFGEKWVGGERPATFDHVFASIQSLRSTGLAHLPRTHFDYVVIDEFHHAGASSYAELLAHVQPRELLGLTATPERADGIDVLALFGGRIAAELRLWDAVDQHRLAPFRYFGISDGVDLRDVAWSRSGYDIAQLTKVLTSDDARAHLVLRAIADKVDAPEKIRALCFCVSVEHAAFMQRAFAKSGVPCAVVSGTTPAGEREQTQRDLRTGKIRVVFSVDVFNEGVDLPEVDTIILLRPTDSATIFLQQLGRGLRKHASKHSCTILDFVGNHRSEFRFDKRLGALLGGSRVPLRDQIESGTSYLPAGCHFELDAQAREHILANLAANVPTRRSALAGALRAMAGDVDLAAFLEATGASLERVYAGQGGTWSALREQAGKGVLAAGPKEDALRNAIGRMLHVDDRERIEAYGRFLRDDRSTGALELTPREARLRVMLLATIVGESAAKDVTVDEAAVILRAHPQIRAELLDLLPLLEKRISHVSTVLASHPDVPLRVHARYSATEILAAFGEGERAKFAHWAKGVLRLEGPNVDLLRCTLDKSASSFSPNTRYRDYAVSETLFHWESPSETRAESAAGKRYREHAARGGTVLLFARESVGAAGYFFLGAGTFVSATGERPMGITWRLEVPLPGDVFVGFAAAVA
jgi:superfamily II DNA or RNA helicase/HKD family nuclease